MEFIFNKLKDDRYFKLSILITFVIAIIFRTYNYLERINVHSDHSLFVQAAIYASDNLIFPQIGPFAQAPFFTGPWWLWFLEIVLFLPFGVLTPWFMMSFLSLTFVVLIFWLGKEIGGKWLGLISSFFAAISPAQIKNSFSVWNAAIDPFLALLALIFLIRFYNHKKALDIFLLGFIVSLATTIHFQNALLIPLLLIAIVTSRLRLKNVLALIVGVIIPILPFVFFDLRFNWFWIRSAYIYVTIDQYFIWVPNRWLTYAGVYWPATWGSIVGGNQIMGGLIIFLLSFLTVLKIKEVKKYKHFYLLALSFLLMVIMFRYYRGERFDYFSNFSHAAVIVLSAWVLLELYKYKKVLGFAFGILLTITTLNQSIQTLEKNGVSYLKINQLKNLLYKNFPYHNFNIKGCTHGGGLISHPLSYFIFYDNRGNVDGLNIGVCDSKNINVSWKLLSKEEASGWLHHDTSTVYKTMTEWWKTNPPK